MAGTLRYYGGHRQVRRPVHVRVDKFTGYGRHIHVTMKEADNPLWEPAANRWVTPVDPEDPGHGIERVMKFNRPETARRWIESTFGAEFSQGTHELLIQDSESYRWFYGEGD